MRGSSPSSVLFFDKPVRAVELTSEESLQVGSLLIRGVKAESDTKEKISSGRVVTICGSMKFLEEMKEAKKILEKKGYMVKVPPLIDPATLKANSEDEKDFLRIKHEMMRRHMENIRTSDAILVMNLSKGKRHNYIGVNTLLEIGAAFENGKSIFILNEPPKEMEEIWALKPNIVRGIKNLSTCF